MKGYDLKDMELQLVPEFSSWLFSLSIHDSQDASETNPNTNTIVKFVSVITVAVVQNIPGENDACE